MKSAAAAPSPGIYEHLKTINGVRFTPREVDIIACLLSGKATKTVSQFLSIEEKTVETHKYNIMRKLECSSKEGIISFIEKSGKFSFIKKHYLDLLIEQSFKKHLQEALLLIGKESPRCVIVYWDEPGNESLFINKLKTYLKITGLFISVECREDHKSLNHLIHKIESQRIRHILCVPSSFLMSSLQGEDNERKLEIFPFIQKASQKVGSVTFILRDGYILKRIEE